MARESAAARRSRAARIVERLARAYPAARCALHYETPFQLLVATVLSAQCTDKKVNEVTPALFRRFPSPRALAEAAPAEVEALVQPTGFFRQKAKSLQAMARDLVERFGGEVPARLDALVTLSGVGRKTANVVLGNAFGIPGLTVDTHMKRVNQRLRLTRHDDPEKIERDLIELLPERDWTDYSNRVIHHGRVCCEARRPQCERCCLRSECPWPTRRGAGAGSVRGAGSRRTGRRARRDGAEAAR
ncbi:MAG: endonuclease III [Deltaproteobacteria bacterium]|nr:MAG: endonuclease III [Deltaproteobacteria bacterium]